MATVRSGFLPQAWKRAVDNQVQGVTHSGAEVSSRHKPLPSQVAAARLEPAACEVPLVSQAHCTFITAASQHYQPITPQSYHCHCCHSPKDTPGTPHLAPRTTQHQPTRPTSCTHKPTAHFNTSCVACTSRAIIQAAHSLTPWCHPSHHQQPALPADSFCRSNDSKCLPEVCRGVEHHQANQNQALLQTS